MQIYELGYLILPSITEDKLLAVAENLKEVIAREGGKVFDGEEPHLHELSYTMAKTVGSSRYVLNDAYIGWLKFELEPESVERVKNSLEKMNELVRFLIIKVPKKTTFTFAQAKKQAIEAESGADAAEAGVPEEMRVE